MSKCIKIGSIAAPRKRCGMALCPLALGLGLFAPWLVGLGSVRAAEVTIDSVHGRWVATEPANAAGLEGLNTSTLKWGIPVSDEAERLLAMMAAAMLGQKMPPEATGRPVPKCAFEFEAAPVRAPQALGSRFLVGRFAHTNVPTDDLSLNKFQAARLEIRVELTVKDKGRAVSDSLTSVFDVELLETQNEGPCPGPTDANGCYDQVAFRLNKARSEGLSIDGVDYVFTLTGFLIGGRSAEVFWTREFARSEAQIEASFAAAATVGDMAESARSRPLGGTAQHLAAPPERPTEQSERPVHLFRR